MWNIGPARRCGAIYQPRLMVSTKPRGTALAQVQLDIAQHLVALARDLVFHERPAPGAEELAEHRPVVYVAAVVADIRIRCVHVRFAPHAVVLVVVAHRPQVGGALRAGRVQAAAVAAHVEIVGDSRHDLAREFFRRAVFPAVRLAPPGSELCRRRRVDMPAGGDDHAVDFARRLGRHGALLDYVMAYFFRIALQRIAEASGRGPDHGVDVVRLLHEVFLAELQGDLFALYFR